MTVLVPRPSRHPGRRRRFTALRAALAALAVFALALTTSTAQSTNPKPTRVFINAIVEQVGPREPNDPTPGLRSLATVHVKLTAVDVDPSPPVHGPAFPTADTGWLTITKLNPNDPRDALEFSLPVDWVELGPGPGQATISAWTLLLFVRDGGSPGNEVVGPPGPGGLAPTRDSILINFFPSGDQFPGSLRGGTIRIDD